MSGQAQPPAKYSFWVEPVVIDGDTVAQKVFMPVYCFSSRKGRGVKGQDVQRLIRNVKKVYPIAREANRRLRDVEDHLLTLKTTREQDRYIKSVERDLKEEYTPVLKNMTFSQGKILIKLIDRETDNTSYELVRQLRGNFSAFFWQSIARIFGANLKDTYQRDGEDKLIEEIITLYEAGLI
ncbi:hypothetical protein FACS1894159_07190 [Bacteroidia bacterium]|nr:hypothetical protein FACS1894159_07190 [Bacteroidia bacterium]